MSATTLPRIDGTIVRYGAVGGLVYAVDITALWVLHAVAGLPLGVATTFALCCAFATNLTLNRIFTFRVSGSVSRQGVRLLILSGLNYLSTLAIVVGLSHVWGAYLVSKTIATVVNAGFNFVAYRRWVFEPVADAPTSVVRQDSMTPRESSGAVAISYVIGAHNSAAAIEETLGKIADRLRGISSEIIVVENGSVDGTIDVLERCLKDWDASFTALRVVVSEKGLGVAWRAGISVSSGDLVVLTADDLPFGFDDLDAALNHGFDSRPILIGSKDHPDSVLQRSAARTVATAGFKLLRRVILGMRTGDPQGTLVVHGPWIRSVNAALVEPGFLMSTELVYAAEATGLAPVEVPVRLRRSEREHRSRVGLSDAWAIGCGLWRLRRRRDELSAAAMLASVASLEIGAPAQRDDLRALGRDALADEGVA